MSRLSGSGAREREGEVGGGVKDAYSVCACVPVHGCSVYAYVRANVQVNRKLSGTRICPSSDNSCPHSPPSDTVLNADLGTGLC